MVNQQAAVSKVAAGSTTSELQPVGLRCKMTNSEVKVQSKPKFSVKTKLVKVLGN